MTELSLITRARSHGDSIAIRSAAGAFSYADVLARSADVVVALLDGENDLNEARIACLVPAGFEYVAAQWGIWRAGGVFVPLSLSATEPELEYTLTDSQANCVLVSRELAASIESLCSQLGLRCLIIEDVAESADPALPEVASARRAMILYTSGTTSRPKGVVTTHSNIEAQITSLIEAWQWQTDDRIPLFLPMHHIHGIINILSCGLWSGATVDTFPRFEMPTILERVAAGAWSVFMAVPTVYVKLIQAIKDLPDDERQRVVDGFAGMRLMISGSAALPSSVHETWSALTGQKLLERYGMTEIGMGLSNPYNGERRPGAVGLPLPGVEIRLKSESGEIVSAEGEPGEIQVRGPGVFSEYWNRPDVTESSFDNGWFRTGDIAVVEDGYYRIMGRQSVDIIKSGGYKLSALEIETALLDHPAIAECAVVGVADETWGEVVSAAVVLRSGQSLDMESLTEWCRDRLSHYRIPRKLLVVDELPRNAMGKVTKPAVRELF
jgi:malonyl-CoA/methylmalonyl-CoA synthetase